MDRVEAITSWRRPGREVHHEHTREVVKESLGLSPEAHAAITAILNRLDLMERDLSAMRATIAAQQQQIDMAREAMSDHAIRVLSTVKEALDRGQQAVEPAA
jgi:alpha-D-ribose 1-methylphosphonate 5-triphosphate synthase subunit PhnL